MSKEKEKSNLDGYNIRAAMIENAQKFYADTISAQMMQYGALVDLYRSNYSLVVQSVKQPSADDLKNFLKENPFPKLPTSDEILETAEKWYDFVAKKS